MPVLDGMMIDMVQRVSMPDVIRAFFPLAVVRDRGAMPSPLREDRHASWSCFRSSDGVWMGKDFSTGEVYTNVRLLQAACPGLSFVDAVDMLSRRFFGRGARRGVSSLAPASSFRPPAPCAAARRNPGVVALRVEGASSLAADSPLRLYWRGRGIGDAVAHRYLSRVAVCISSLAGVILRDSDTGLPLLSRDGRPLKDDGMRECLGILNDIGGWSLRQPDAGMRRGFKGCTSSYVTSLFADGGSLAVPSLEGDGGGSMEGLRYDDGAGRVYVGESRYFGGVGKEAFLHAEPFLRGHASRVFSERGLLSCGAALAECGHPVSGEAYVVEGMFDALSLIELREGMPPADVVVLNGVGNVRYALPLLSRERSVGCFFDNDLRSGAGGRAYDELAGGLRDYCARLGRPVPALRSWSSVLGGKKDLNEFLVSLRRAGAEARLPVREAGAARRSCGMKL